MNNYPLLILIKTILVFIYLFYRDLFLLWQKIDDNVFILYVN